LNGKGEGIRRALFAFGLAAVVCGFVGLLSARNAKAEDLDPLKGIECTGKVTAAETSIFPDAYAFEFGCTQDIFAFSIVSNREIDSFSTEIIGVKPDGEPGENEDFFCVGAVPANGFGCYANPGKTPAIRISAGNKGIGEFTLSGPICDANAQPRFWGIALAEYSTTNDLDPENPVTRTWLATSEPFPINSSGVRCKILNPKAKARQMCAKARKAKGPKAKAILKAKCNKLRAAARDSGKT
jgi:hypothetical protein